MKKFSLILQYISKYKGKLVVYLVFTILSTLFGLISRGMLSPFMEILFKTGGAAHNAAAIHTNAVGSLKNIIEDVMNRYGATAALIAVCILIIVSTVLKNLFLYWSYYISSPIRSATITFLRNEVYGKILSLPIGYFTE